MTLKNINLALFVFLLASCGSISSKKTELKSSTAKASVIPSKNPKKITGASVPAASALKIQAQQPLASVAPAIVIPDITLDPIGHLQGLMKLSIESRTKTEQDSFRQRAIETVENRLDDKHLEEVASDSDFGYLRAYAMFRLGEKYLDEKDISESKKYFSSVIDILPGSEIALRAQEVKAQLEATEKVTPTTIGAVLPLSGKNASVGQRALRGLEIGLGLHIPGSKFKLAVVDSEGNPDSARRGVERLVKEDNVIAIVGSLLSKTGSAVAAKAEELGVPSIALSQKAGLPEIGPTVFRNSLTSGMQVRYLVRTAMLDLGMKKFAILYPNDPYGVEFANIFWDEVLARGGEIAAIQSYSNKETDFRLVIQRLVGTYYGEARQEEFNTRMRELQSSDKKKSARSNTPETILPPVVDFDGIFIPDSAKSLGQIAAMLATNDVRNVKLLGTNIWNTPDLAKRAGNFVNNIIFVDTLDPSTKETSHFASEYKALYNEQPSLIELQAYDSGLILRQLITSGSDSRSEIIKKLTELDQFPGAAGNLTMSPDREIQRPLIPLTISKGEVIPLMITK